MDRGSYASVVPDELVVLAQKRKGQAPPPSVVWEALGDPLAPSRGYVWFDQRPGEVAPEVLAHEQPHRLLWSSIWADQPDLRIELLVEADGSGSVVTWSLLGRAGQLDADDLKRRRYRLNQLVNGRLRDFFD